MLVVLTHLCPNGVDQQGATAASFLNRPFTLAGRRQHCDLYTPGGRVPTKRLSRSTASCAATGLNSFFLGAHQHTATKRLRNAGAIAAAGVRGWPGLGCSAHSRRRAAHLRPRWQGRLLAYPWRGKARDEAASRPVCATDAGASIDHPERRYSRLVGRSEAGAPERAGPRLRVGAQRPESADRCSA